MLHGESEKNRLVAAIFLAKNELGYSDRQELGGPGQFREEDARRMSTEELQAIAGEGPHKNRKEVPGESVVITGPN